MPILSFDKRNVDILATDMEAALQDVAKRHGLVLSRAGGKFSSGTFTPKFSFSTVVLTPIPGTDDALGVPASFARQAYSIGLKPSDYGKTFSIGGKQYRITDINTRRSAYPVSATRVSDGKGFKFAGIDVALALNGHM